MDDDGSTANDPDGAQEATPGSTSGGPVRADGGRDPDYRMSLAAERTYLAYLRTGLALTAAGVAVATALPNAHALGLRRVLGACLVVAGAAVFAVARPRWAAVVRAMQSGQPLPSSWLPTALAVVLTASAVGGLIVVLLA